MDKKLKDSVFLKLLSKYLKCYPIQSRFNVKSSKRKDVSILPGVINILIQRYFALKFDFSFDSFKIIYW